MNLTEALLKMMRIAHPLIDNYFFNDKFRFESSEFQYFDEVLSEISCRLRQKATSLPGASEKIAVVKQQLLQPELSKYSAQLVINATERDFLNGAMILDEFCKEIGALINAKAVQSILTNLPEV